MATLQYLLEEALPPLLTYLLFPLVLLQGTYLVPGQVGEDPARGALAASAPAASSICAQGAQVAIVETVQLRRQAVVSGQRVLARAPYRGQRVRAELDPAAQQPYGWCWSLALTTKRTGLPPSSRTNG